MLEKIKYLNGQDVNALTTIVNINVDALLLGDAAAYQNIDYSKLKYFELISVSVLPENRNVSFDVENQIEALMLDCFDSYMKLKKHSINDFCNNFVKVYEKIILNSKFENITLRSFQRQILINKMNEHIRLENYEICSEIKHKMEEI
jgi:hypothetical protein